MEPQQNEAQSVIAPLKKVTPLSKNLAMVLFVLLPFVGGYVGYTLAPETVIEIEKVATQEKETHHESPVKTNYVATTTVDMGEYRISYDQNVLQLINDKSEVLQSITVRFSELNGYTDSESLVIKNRDINYDHYLDVGILNSVGYGGVNRFYRFYVYDPETGRLVLEESLGQNEDAVSNPTFDIQNRYLYSNMKSGQDWVREQFIFKDGKYIDENTWVKRYGIQKD